MSKKEFTHDELRKAYLEALSTPRIKLDEPTLWLWGAFDFDLPDAKKASFTKPMGENLCIIDLDNRPFNDQGGIFGPKPMSWDQAKEVHGLSTGVLNHWIYGMRQDMEPSRWIKEC